MFPSPTCPFRSAPRTILSCFYTLSINPSRSCQKSFFPPMLLPTCGAYLLTMFSIDPFTSGGWPLFCLTPSSPPRHFQAAPPSTPSLSCFFFHELHCRIVYSHPQCFSLYSLSTLFPVNTVYLHSFNPSCLPALSPFQSLFLYLRYPPL